MKRIFCIAFISIVCCFSFLTGYCSLYSVPVYADAIPEGYTQSSSREQLTDAFLSYCKTRDSELTSSVLGASATYAYSVIQKASSALGISIDDLQAQLYYQQENHKIIKWFMTASGISLFNDIFAYLIQQEDLEVGQPADKQVYSTLKFTDVDGNKCFVYVLNNSYSFGPVLDSNLSSYIDSAGSNLKYQPIDFKNLYDSGSTSFSINVTDDYTANGSIQYYSGNYNQFSNIDLYSEPADTFDSGALYGSFYEAQFDYSYFRLGSFIITMKNDNPGVLHFAKLVLYHNNFGNYTLIRDIATLTTDTEELTPVTVNFVSNNITQEYEGDTVINNIVNNDPDPDPDQGDDWNPVLPDVPGAGSDPSGGNTIDWPDLDLPDFNLPNFSLGDLRLKFPFSIPFDIVSILGVINAPAVAPVIQEEIPIRIDLMNVDYTIPINLDMSDSLYNDFAVLVRAVEFIGFCIGLIHLTIRLVKG